MKYTDLNGEIPIVSFVAGFIRGLAGGSSFRESIDIGWKTEINSWKLTGGLFVTDRDKSFFGKVGQIVSWFTYELPKTLIGLSIGYVGNIAYDSDVEYFAGATITRINNRRKFGGITLGSYILGDNTIIADPSTGLFQHEYGHYLQSQSVGLLYSFIYGLPSLFDAMINDY